MTVFLSKENIQQEMGKRLVFSQKYSVNSFGKYKSMKMYSILKYD